MTDLATQTALSTSGVTRVVDRLEHRSLVGRESCPSDRRGSNAVLTTDGRRRLEKAAPSHVRGVRAYFIDQLTEKELANLAAALARVDVDAARAAGGCDVSVE